MSNIVVIGCGVFGALAALRLAQDGHKVTVVERLDAPMQGASRNNQNRLHLGFHYPRSLETARQCIAGYQRFVDEYADCVLQGFQNGYFIASNGSFTTPEDYLKFCQTAGLDFQEMAVSDFPVRIENVGLCIITGEGVYDSRLVGEKIMRRFIDTQITTFFGNEVVGIENKGDHFTLKLSAGEVLSYDGVVNASYANQNTLNGLAGFKTPRRQFEYTAVPILETSFGEVGMTIMDGPFMTVLPYGKTGDHLLYNVKNSVVDTQITPQLPADWLDIDQSPFSKLDKMAYFEQFISDCSAFIPELQNARLKGFLEGPRMVLRNVDDTDERPSMVNWVQENYVSVFSGKTDHSIWVADEVSEGFAKL